MSLFVSMSFCSFDMFFCLNVCQFLRLWLCLFVWLLHCSGSLNLLNVFTVILSFDFLAHLLFLSIVTHRLLFCFSSVHWGRFQNIEFERYGLPLPVRCMSKMFKLSANYFVLFVLQRGTFCFCLFLKLSLATTTGVDPWLYYSFNII